MALIAVRDEVERIERDGCMGNPHSLSHALACAGNSVAAAAMTTLAGMRSHHAIRAAAWCVVAMLRLRR